MAPHLSFLSGLKRLAHPLLLAAAVALGSGAAKPAGPGSQPPVIQEISWRDFGLVLKASAPLDPEIFTLEKPYRFVVDLPDAELAEPSLARTIPVAQGPVQRIRLDQKDKAVRLVVDCKDSTGFQVVQVGDRSTLLLVRSGQRHPDLAAILKSGRYTGYGQEIRSVWARETGSELKLHLRSAKALTYSLHEDDARRMQLRIPAGHYANLLPKTGKLLSGVQAKTAPDGTWTLDLALAEGHFQVHEARTADKTGLTLTFNKIEPRRFANRPLVIIDPGHGGSDPGALGPNGTPEKAVCLDLAQSLQQALWKKRINAVLTRSADVEVLLAPRLAMIDKLGADMFISLHANSHTGPESMGTETYWREAHSQPFAFSVHQKLTGLLKRPDRGVKQERLYVIRHGKVPSILVETGFISNPAEERLLADGQFQQNAAAAIVAGVESYLSTPPLARGL